MKINNNLIPSIPELPSELYVAHLQEKLAIHRKLTYHVTEMSDKIKNNRCFI